MKVSFKAGRTDDPERAVLPALVYCSSRHPYFDQRQSRGGFSVAIGWWAWNVAVYVTWRIMSPTPDGDKP